MNFKKNKFYFQSLVISIGLLLHLTGFNVFAGPGDDFAQAPTAGPGKELVPVSPCTYTAGSKDLGKDLPLALQEIDIANSGEYLAPASPSTNTAGSEDSVNDLLLPLPGTGTTARRINIPRLPDTTHSKLQTPLMIAAANGDLYKVSCLIERGANIHEEDKNGNTPFMYAQKNDHSEVEDLLIEKMQPPLDDISSLLLAIKNGDRDKVAALLEDIDYKIDHYFRTVLNYAYKKHHHEITKLLFKKILKKYTNTEVMESDIKELTQKFEQEKTQLEQKKIDKQLVDSVWMNDAIAVERSLAQGANLNQQISGNSLIGYISKYPSNDVFDALMKYAGLPDVNR